LKIKPWKTGINYLYFGFTLLCFAVAFGVWILDIQKIICRELSFLQLHGVWHFLCATATYTLFLFYNSEKEKPQFQPYIWVNNNSSVSVENNVITDVQINYHEQVAPTPRSAGILKSCFCCGDELDDLFH
jgi:hypothetical protein